jgi:hypothetical protein
MPQLEQQARATPLQQQQHQHLRQKLCRALLLNGTLTR